jgi:hypothetical protein
VQRTEVDRPVHGRRCRHVIMLRRDVRSAT